MEDCIVDGVVLGHLFGGIVIADSMKECFHRDMESFVRWCNVVDRIYQSADENVENVLYVTIIEQLEEESDVWEAFVNRVAINSKNICVSTLLQMD